MAIPDQAEKDGLDALGPGIADGMSGSVERAADLLRSLGSSHRLMILCLLAERDRTVTEVCDLIGMRQSLASQHLGRLRLDGLVKAERKGHFVHYSLVNPVAREIVSILHRHFCPDGVPSIPGQLIGSETQ